MSDFDHPLCTFCDAHHRNANQPGGCVVYWQGRADAAEAQVERLRAVVEAVGEIAAAEMHCPVCECGHAIGPSRGLRHSPTCPVPVALDALEEK